MAKEVNKEKKTDKKVKNEKDKKSFAKDFKAELKKVSWPTPKQLVNNTAIVIVIVLVTAALVFVLDVIFETLNKYGVEALKAMVTSNTSQTTDDGNNVNIEDGATVIDSAGENVTSETGAENTVTNESVEDTNTATDEAVSEQ